MKLRSPAAASTAKIRPRVWTVTAGRHPRVGRIREAAVMLKSHQKGPTPGTTAPGPVRLTGRGSRKSRSSLSKCRRPELFFPGTGSGAQYFAAAEAQCRYPHQNCGAGERGGQQGTEHRHYP